MQIVGRSCWSINKIDLVRSCPYFSWRLSFTNCRYEKGGERREKAGFTFLNRFERTKVGQQNVNIRYFKKLNSTPFPGRFSAVIWAQRFCSVVTEKCCKSSTSLLHCRTWKLPIFMKQIRGLCRISNNFTFTRSTRKSEITIKKNKTKQKKKTWAREVWLSG